MSPGLWIACIGPTLAVLGATYSLYGRLVRIELGVTGLVQKQERLEDRQERLAEHSVGLVERISKLEGTRR